MEAGSLEISNRVLMKAFISSCAIGCLLGLTASAAPVDPARTQKSPSSANTANQTGKKPGLNTERSGGDKDKTEGV
jgi:hypothetical protein